MNKEEIMKIECPKGSRIDDLSLSPWRENTTVAAWVEFSANAHQVKWRLLSREGQKFGECFATAAVCPSNPRVAGDRLLWVDRHATHGLLHEIALDENGTALGPFLAVKPMAEMNCGDFASIEADGSISVLIQERFHQSVQLRLLRTSLDSWKDCGALDLSPGFRSRPVLRSTPNGLMAAWDQYAGGRYNVATARINNGVSTILTPLSEREECESLPEIACAADGTIY